MLLRQARQKGSRLPAAAQAFTEKLDPQHDPREVVVDFRASRVADMSGIEARHKLTDPEYVVAEVE